MAMVRMAPFFDTQYIEQISVNILHLGKHLSRNDTSVFVTVSVLEKLLINVTRFTCTKFRNCWFRFTVEIVCKNETKNAYEIVIMS